VTSEIIGNRSRIIGSTQNNQEYLYEALDYVAKGKVTFCHQIYEIGSYSHEKSSFTEHI
jgi:D-arabinose 1-dehydrogenase-like Zn-dependent alcohol dehydrogenase